MHHVSPLAAEGYTRTPAVGIDQVDEGVADGDVHVVVHEGHGSGASPTPLQQASPCFIDLLSPARRRARQEQTPSVGGPLTRCVRLGCSTSASGKESLARPLVHHPACSRKTNRGRVNCALSSHDADMGARARHRQLLHGQPADYHERHHDGRARGRGQPFPRAC